MLNRKKVVSFSAAHRRGSDDSIGSDVEHTRMCIERLDYKVASISDDVANLSADVRTILHLLRHPGSTSSVETQIDSPTVSAAKTSPESERNIQFSPNLQRANQHRDSIASAPGLSSGISLVGILKNGNHSGDRTSPSGGENRVNFVTSRSVDCVQLPLTTTSIQPAGEHSRVRLRSPLATSPTNNVEWPSGRNYPGSSVRTITTPPSERKLESGSHDSSGYLGSNAQSDVMLQGEEDRDSESLLAGHESRSGQQKVSSDDSGTDSPKGWQSRGMSSSTSGSGSRSLPPATPTPLPPTAASPFRLTDSTGDMHAELQLQEFKDSTSPDRSPSSPLQGEKGVTPIATDGSHDDAHSSGDSDSLSETDSQASHTPFLSTEL